MPKRKMTPARRVQIWKWQQAGVKARQKKEGRIPVGKNVLLVHRTSIKAANSIVEQQKFNDFKWKYGIEKGKAKAYFTPASSKSGARFYRVFGEGAVSVRVSRKVLKPDPHRNEGRIYGAVTVDLKDLAGVKIEKYIRRRRRK